MNTVDTNINELKAEKPATIVASVVRFGHDALIGTAKSKRLYDKEWN